MATEKISEIEYSLGEKNTILDRFFELGSHCVLDAENWKFFRTLRIGSWHCWHCFWMVILHKRFLDSSHKSFCYYSYSTWFSVEQSSVLLIFLGMSSLKNYCIL